MADVRTNLPVRSVYFGDVVAASSGPVLVGPTPWWLFAAFLAFPAVLWVLVFRCRYDEAEVFFWPSLVIVPLACFFYIWVGVRTALWRRRLDALAHREDETYGQLAERLWYQTLVRARGRLWFDAATWIARVGPDGPRMIMVEADLPDIPPNPDDSEEVPIGVDAALGSRERRQRLWQVGLCGLNLALMSTFLFARPFVWYWAWPAVVWAVFVGFALYRLGLRPVSLGASSAVPGLIRVTRGGTTREFGRADSVLVMQNRANLLIVWVCRRDGATAKLWFYGGKEDPGLRQLVERWCWKADKRQGGALA